MEGPACRVRQITFHHPSKFSGHDKHAPPNSFAHAFIARRDPLVGSAELRLMVHRISVGVTSMPLRKVHDKRAPPIRLVALSTNLTHTLRAVCYPRQAPQKLFT